MNLKKLIAVLLFSAASLEINAQAATAYFTCPDTVCVNQTFTINNLCSGATTYYWSFCQGNTNSTPTATNLGNIGFFNGPVFTTIAKDGNNYYAFVTNNWNSTLSRLFYGSSLLNIPVAVNLGNIGGQFPNSLEDLHLEYEAGNWYGIAVGGLSGTERILRLNFGSSLANTPTAINMGNIGAMNYPQRLRIFNSGGNYYGFVSNRNNNTITRFSFGSSITNVPTGVNLGNLGSLNTPDAIGLINWAGMWYGYVINEGSNSITRLDFGASLLNIPAATNLGNTGALNGPRGLDVWVECNQIRGLITNRYSNDLVNMNFTGGPTAPIITTSMGNLANFSFPHSIGRFRSGDTLYAFITNVNNSTMSRIYYPGCTSASIASSTLATPPPISYNTPGTYYINVVINEGQISQASYCKPVVVLNTPTIQVSGNTTICSGGSTTLTSSGATTYTWYPGNTNGSSIVINPTTNTNYTVVGSMGTCSNSAVAVVSVTPGFTLGLAASSSTICSGNSATLTANGASSYTWNPGPVFSQNLVVSPATSSVYTVTGANANCFNTQTLAITVNSTPIINILNSGPVCSGNSGTLTASGAISYTWIPGNMTSSVVLVNPNSTTSYTVTGETNNCANTAVSTLTVNPTPSVNVITSASVICSGNSANLSASGANTYTWFPGSITGSVVNVSPSNNITYTVVGITALCSSAATVAVVVHQTPSVTLNSTGSGCVGESINLYANGSSAYSYTWSGPNGFVSNLQNPVFTPTTSGSGGIYTLAVDNNGCTIQVNINVGVNTFTPAQVYSSGMNGCAPLCVSYSVQANQNSLIQWTFGDGGSVTGNSISHCFKNAGTYSVNVDVINPTGCNSRGVQNVIVYPKPVAEFNFNPLEPTVGEEINFTDASYDSIISWNWYFMNNASFTSASQNPYFTYDDAGTYAAVLLVKNNYGCTDTIIKIINVKEEFCIYIPNAFTPNGDNLNDIFQPKGTGIDKYEMRIFDRWGEQLFVTEEFEKGWDGTFQGRGNKLCPSDVYTCQVKVTSVYGKSYVFNRHVTLMK